MNNIDRIASMLTEDPDVLNELNWSGLKQKAGTAAQKMGATAKRAGAAGMAAAKGAATKFRQPASATQPAPTRTAPATQAAAPTGLTARNPEFAHLMSELMTRMKQRGEGTPISKRLRSQYGTLIQQMQKSGLIDIQPVNTLMLTAKGQDMASRIDTFLNANRGVRSTTKANVPAMQKRPTAQ